VGVAGGVLLVVNAIATLMGVRWSWAITATGVVGLLAPFFGQVVAPLRARRAEVAEANQQFRAVLDAYPAPIISQANPYEMGVLESPAAEGFGAGDRPPYVERAVDKVLRPAIAAMADKGGLVVVRGVPLSGKSRTLWEALVDQVGSRVVYGVREPIGEGPTVRPVSTFVENAAGIDGARSIIWIDDVHDHFGYGLDETVLTRDLLGRYPGVIVAMTVHTHRLTQIERAEGAPPVVEDPKLIDHLREASARYDLADRWTDDELDLARAAYPGLEERVEHPGDFKTLARWFGGVKHLQERYGGLASRAGNKRGIAVAKAAIDWRRAGMPAGITTEQLRGLARIELRALDPNVHFSEETFHEGLDWATAKGDSKAHPRWEGIALVRPMPETDPVRWRDFDAITAWAPTDQGGPDGPLSDDCWEYLLQHVSRHTAMRVGLAADRADKPSFAERAFGVGANSGDAHAMVSLGLLFRKHSRTEEAEAAYRDAIATGHPDWAPRAMFNLGVLFDDGGRTKEAEAAYRDAIATRHPDWAPTAMFNLGVLFDEDGRTKAAKAAYRDAIATRHRDWAPVAMVNLGLLYQRPGEIAGRVPETAFGAAIASRHPDQAPKAMVCLGQLCQRAGRTAEAEAAFRDAIATGHPNEAPLAMLNLGILYGSAGRTADAEAAFRDAIATGHPDAAHLASEGLEILRSLASGEGSPPEPQ
jgi:tetratricopeptide (TPR) repeat protein